MVPNAQPRDLGELPLQPGSAYAARWDLAHAQALVAIRGATGLERGQAEYWLVRYRDREVSSQAGQEAAG